MWHPYSVSHKTHVSQFYVINIAAFQAPKVIFNVALAALLAKLAKVLLKSP